MKLASPLMRLPVRPAPLPCTTLVRAQRGALQVCAGWKKGVGEVLRLKKPRNPEQINKKQAIELKRRNAAIPRRRPRKEITSKSHKRALLRRWKKIRAHQMPIRKLRYRNMEEWGTYNLGRLGVKEHEGPRFRHHDMRDHPGQHEKDRKRLGRGNRSNHGGSSGRGVEGSKKRAGSCIKPWWEGGQKPLHHRLPVLPGMLGRRKKWYKDFIDAPLWKMERKFEDGEEVTLEALLKRHVIKANLVERKRLSLRIIALPEDPPFTKKLTIHAQVFIPDAKELIEKNGGTCVELYRHVPLRLIPLANRDEARKALYRRRWIRRGRLADGDEESFQKLLRTDKQYLHDLIQFRRSARYQKRLRKIELRKKAGLITTKEEEEAALKYIAPKPTTKLPPGFNPIFYRTGGQPI